MNGHSGEPTGEAPVRVLWLIKGLGPGGAERLLVSAARVVDHERFTIETAYIRPDKTHLVAALEAEGVPTHLVAGPNGRWLWPLRLRAQMAGFDIVHAHSPLLAGVARVIARTLPRRPLTVSTEHNVWANFAWPTRLLNAVTAPLDAQRWAVSDEARRSMWRPLRPGASVLVHGIVLDDETPAPGTRERIRAEFGIPSDAVVALIVANFRREKDYPNVLRAARRALDADPRFWLAVVGQGPLDAEVRALHAQLGLGERVVLAGYRADVADLMAAADLFTLGSATEGLPVSIMEAMAAGLPVVATAVGGVPQAVTPHTGRLVAPHDDAALAAAWLELVTDPALRERMASAAIAGSAVFDIRTAMTVQQKAYAALVARRPQ